MREWYRIMVVEACVFVLIGVGVSMLGEPGSRFPSLTTSVFAVLAAAVALLLPSAVLSVGPLAVSTARVARGWAFVTAAFVLSVVVLDLMHGTKKVSLVLFAALPEEEAWVTLVRLRTWTLVVPAILIAVACIIGAAGDLLNDYKGSPWTKRAAARLSGWVSIAFILLVDTELTVGAQEQTKVNMPFAERSVRDTSIFLMSVFGGVELVLVIVQALPINIVTKLVATVLLFGQSLWWNLASVLLLPASARTLNLAWFALHFLCAAVDVVHVWEADLHKVAPQLRFAGVSVQGGAPRTAPGQRQAPAQGQAQGRPWGVPANPNFQQPRADLTYVNPTYVNPTNIYNSTPLPMGQSWEQEPMLSEATELMENTDWDQSGMSQEVEAIGFPQPDIDDTQQQYDQTQQNMNFSTFSTPAFVADLRRTRPTISAQARQDLQPWLEVPARVAPRKDSVYSVAPERLLRARRGKTE